MLSQQLEEKQRAGAFSGGRLKVSASEVIYQVDLKEHPEKNTGLRDPGLLGCL